MSESRHDEQSRIPSWNGDPSTWTSFSDEVKLWRRSESMEVNYSLASRLVRQLSGSARRALAKLPAEELHPPYVASPGPGRELDPGERKAWRNNTGIDNVMAKLLKDLGQQKPARKGQTIHEFFGTTKYQRRRGERVTDWLTRFEEGLTRLREDDINLLELEDVAGWFCSFELASLRNGRSASLELCRTSISRSSRSREVSLGCFPRCTCSSVRITAAIAVAEPTMASTTPGLHSRPFRRMTRP